MMEINRNNYEIFFLDYLDGKLKGSEIDQFLDFVNKNPDLKDELEGMQDIKLPIPELNFNGKNLLYKVDGQKTKIEDFTVVAYAEGDLSELDSKLFEQYMEFHPEQKAEVLLLKKARLQPDMSIVFPAKGNLYKHSLKQRFIYWGTRAAAVLLISSVLAGTWYFKESRDLLSKSIALIQEPSAKKEEKPISGNEEKQKKIAEKEDFNEPVEKVAIQKSNTPQQVAKKEKQPVVPEKKLIKRQPEVVNLLRPIMASAVSVKMEKQPLAEMDEKTTIMPRDNSYSLDAYLAKKVLNIETNEKTLVESGLDLAGNITGNRINYETSNGKVSKIHFDSRFLAFSVPIKNK